MATSELCRLYLAGKCHKSDTECRYSHAGGSTLQRQSTTTTEGRPTSFSSGGGGKNHRGGGSTTGAPSSSKSTCDYCSRPGHHRRQCYKLQNDKAKQQGPQNKANQAQVKEEEPTLFSFVARAPPAVDTNLPQTEGEEGLNPTRNLSPLFSGLSGPPSPTLEYLYDPTCDPSLPGLPDAELSTPDASPWGELPIWAPDDFLADYDCLTSTLDFTGSTSTTLDDYDLPMPPLEQSTEAERSQSTAMTYHQSSMPKLALGAPTATSSTHEVPRTPGKTYKLLRLC